jgi:hypothetical protein
MASTTVEIARPPDEVFAFVTDPTKLCASQDAEEVQQLTVGPVRAGTRFREVQKAHGPAAGRADRGGRVRSRPVVSNPRRRGAASRRRWEFAPTPGGGTRVTLTPLAHLPGRARIANRRRVRQARLTLTASCRPTVGSGSDTGRDRVRTQPLPLNVACSRCQFPIRPSPEHDPDSFRGRPPAPTSDISGALSDRLTWLFLAAVARSLLPPST